MNRSCLSRKKNVHKITKLKSKFQINLVIFIRFHLMNQPFLDMMNYKIEYSKYGVYLQKHLNFDFFHKIILEKKREIQKTKNLKEPVNKNF